MMGNGTLDIGTIVSISLNISVPMLLNLHHVNLFYIILKNPPYKHFT